MQFDDIYWNNTAISDEEEEDYQPHHHHHHHHHQKDYVDPWDLENYAYIRGHLNSDPNTSTGEAHSSSFYYVPGQTKEKDYAAIDEIRPYIKNGAEYAANSFESDDENSYEENRRYDNSSTFYESPQKNRWRRVTDNNNKKTPTRKPSFYEYGPNPDIYSKLDEIYRESLLLPIYDDLKSDKTNHRTNFSLTNYGHLKIDYSYSWNNLNKYICN